MLTGEKSQPEKFQVFCFARDIIGSPRAETHRPVIIKGRRAGAIMVAGGDWNAIRETLYPVSVPGVRKLVTGGMATPAEDCSGEPGWQLKGNRP
jgi:PHD/YefM family antitoxin component YafN of YafNO toxin-antitoxin module